MTISERISRDFTEALKSGNKAKVSVLRMIKAAMKNREIEKGSTLNDEDINAVLRSYAKRAAESLEQYSKAERGDLVEKEKEELAVVQEYLPKQLDEEEVRAIVSEVIDEAGAQGPGDMGKVMKSVMARIAGRAEGKMVNTLVKEQLEQK